MNHFKDDLTLLQILLSKGKRDLINLPKTANSNQ